MTANMNFNTRTTCALFARETTRSRWQVRVSLWHALPRHWLSAYGSQGAVNLDAEIAHGTLVALAKKDPLRAGTFAGLESSNRCLRPVGPRCENFSPVPVCEAALCQIPKAQPVSPVIRSIRC
jgi:hypothetical protein